VTGTAASASVSVKTGDKVLVTLYTSCKDSEKQKACYMSFEASGAGISQAASDSAMVGGGYAEKELAIGQSGSFLFTAGSTGTVTFTAKYKVDAGTGTFLSHSITAQVFE
jgi:hypothetical protein